MKRVQVSEIAEALDDVRRGQTVEIADGDKLIAKLIPTDDHPQKALYERVERLIAEGKIKRGFGKLPPDFFTTPLPKLPDGLTGSGAVLEEREESPW